VDRTVAEKYASFMSRVDDELAQALRESEQTAAAQPAPAPAADRPRNNRSLGLLLGLLVMGGGILTLVFTTFDDAKIYSRGVEELLRDKDKMAGRNVRVEGMLKQGTLVRRDEPCEYRFTMQRGGKEIAVRYAQCVVPDTFKDVPGIEVAVTAEGSLHEGGHFEASHIMAKCPSKYEMQQRAQKGERAPHAAMPGSVGL
jgi:cytochrome c-type biogenesis protein CcmE